MTFPPDLPWIVEYRVGCTVRGALPRRRVESISSSGETNARIVCPTIPYGADAWRVAGGDWQPLESIPEAWRPFLMRQRGTLMDPRPPLEK